MYMWLHVPWYYFMDEGGKTLQSSKHLVKAIKIKREIFGCYLKTKSVYLSLLDIHVPMQKHMLLIQYTHTHTHTTLVYQKAQIKNTMQKLISP